MNEIVLDSFRHNAWATRHLLEFCRPLTYEQLTPPGTGTFGGILATLDHIIRSDGSYAWRCADKPLAWVDGDGSEDIDEPPDIQAWEYAWHTGRIWEK